MYGESAQRLWEIHEGRLDGACPCVLFCLSASRLDEISKTALEKSAEALGFGKNVWCFCALEVPGAADKTSDGQEARAADGTASDAMSEVFETPADDATTWALATPEKLDEKALFELIEGLDPVALVAADSFAASALSHAYRSEVRVDARNRVFGRTCIAFRDFNALMKTSESKQRAWALLKRLY